MSETPPTIRTSPLTQAGWLVFQTAIVAFVVYVDYEVGNPRRPGIALALGIGWAISATVLLHLLFNGLRRAVNALRRIKHKQSGKALALDRRLSVGQATQERPRSRIGNDVG